MVGRTEITPNDLGHLPLPEDGKAYELSHGELIVVPMSIFLLDFVKQRIGKILTRYTLQYPVGEVFTESMFTINDGARIPDLAFVSNQKIESITDYLKVASIAPDLAIEVISPSETFVYAQTKLDDYFAAGVSEVWQVVPVQRFVIVRTAGSVIERRGDQLLETPLLPGFNVPVSQFFPVK